MENVVIIGAGIGGLIAGSLLAKKGYKVTIFEAHGAPGGYTAGFYRKGYYFESGTVSFEASASVFKAMKDIGALGKIDFEKQRLRLYSEDFDGIPGSYGEFKRLIYSAFPAEKGKLDTAFRELDKIAAMTENMDKPLPFLYSGFEFFKAVLPFAAGGVRLMKLAGHYGNMTSSEFAAKYFEKGSKLHRLFCSFGYPEMSAMMVGSSLSGLFADLWTVKGGMQSWADVLAENFRELGGGLRLNSRVDRIITKDKAAVGVLCNHTVYDADYVISAGDYKKTLLKLLDDDSLVPETLRDKIGAAPVSEGYFTVYLGLNLKDEGLKKYMKAPHVLFFNLSPGFGGYNSDDEEFFNKTSVELYSPSMENPGLAPEGKSSLMLQAKVPCRWMDNWGGGDREAYLLLKQKAADALISGASRLIPGLSGRIEYRDAATPLTYEKFTGNTDGASCAWCWNPEKKFYQSAMSANIETPVKNLYIGSCWAMQVGGVPGALAAAYRCAGKIK